MNQDVPQVILLGTKEAVDPQVVVTLFSKDRVCFDRFDRLSHAVHPTRVHSVAVGLPRSRGRARQNPPKKVSWGLAEEAEADESVLPALKLKTAEPEDPEDEEFKDLWAAEQWVERNYRERRRVLEEEGLEAEEKDVPELNVDLRTSWYQAQRADAELAPCS